MQNKTQEVSRRSFLAQTSYLSAMYAAASMIPLRALAENLVQDPRISATPIVDKGFASVRKIGNGLYATISDTLKGPQTMCNGGFVVGKDGAIAIEGFVSAAGAAFQLETLHSVTQVPIKGALDTHYHFDHSMGNAVYGAHGIPLWAHAATAKRIYDSYGPWQWMDKAAVTAPLEKQLTAAKSDVAKKHLQGDLATIGNVYDLVNASQLALPNHSFDPAKGPHKMDLGGLAVVIEHYPGHSGTDMIVRVPEQNVVYTGDLLFNGYFPITFDEQATISGWRATLKTFASWDKDTLFVPGHGQLCGQEAIAMFRSTFDDIEEQAMKLYKAGVPMEEAQHQYVVPEKFSKLSTFTWGFSIGPTIQKMYKEWDAKK
ncbi:MAG TPA: MBL fold metallo-hydrolase [Candidatus Dormibacteraeota bacterium]|nr:MBL fold metallo-hydrolase [Candidatus Dormibacteraeota bacterium]